MEDLETKKAAKIGGFWRFILATLDLMDNYAAIANHPNLPTAVAVHQSDSCNVC